MQEEDESLKSFIYHFTKAASKVINLSDNDAITAPCDGLQKGSLLKSTIRKVLTTLIVFLSLIKKFINE